MPQLKYSVIIPHKNIPHLLQRMLDSIPQREDLEVIVVDDNSDPGKVDFDHFPGQDRPNTHLIFTKEGRGAGYARNVGIDHAQGEWLIFADADDYFLTEDFDSFLNIQYPSDAEIIVWETTYDAKSPSPLLNGGQIERRTSVKDICDMYITPWHKMVHSQYIRDNDIKFEETYVSNDVMFSVGLTISATHYYYYPQVIYVVEQRPEGLSWTVNVRTIGQRIDVGIRAKCCLKKNGINLHDANWLDTIYHLSHMHFYYYLFKELLLLGYYDTKCDYLLACEGLKIHPNPFCRIWTHKKKT